MAFDNIIRFIRQGTVDNKLGPDRSAGPNAPRPSNCRQNSVQSNVYFPIFHTIQKSFLFSICISLSLGVGLAKGIIIHRSVNTIRNKLILFVFIIYIYKVFPQKL